MAHTVYAISARQSSRGLSRMVEHQSPRRWRALYLISEFASEEELKRFRRAHGDGRRDLTVAQLEQFALRALDRLHDWEPA